MLYLIVLFIISFTPLIQGMHDAKTVFVEIDDVLLEPDPLHGYANYTWLTKSCNDSVIEKTQKRLIELTTSIDPKNILSETIELPTFEKLPTFRNCTLPYVWCLYLTGYITSVQILQLIQNHLDSQAGYFERPLLNAAAQTAFKPEAEAAVMTPKDNLIKIIQQLAASKTHRLFVLANKHPDTISHLRKLFPHIFNVFDDVFVSGQTRHLKPNKQAYEHLLNLYDLNPATCYTIESQKSYAHIAQEVGITPIVYEGDDQKLLSTLQHYGLIEYNEMTP